MINTFIFAVWLLSAMWLCTLSLDMVSAPNTIENVVGFLLLVLTVIISIKTKCFTKIKKLWKK